MRAILQNQAVVLALAIAITLLLALNAIIVPLAEIPLHIVKNPNEGWNAYFAARAMNGQTIYPQAPELLVNNYPPLSFYLVGWVGKLTGDNIVAGRIVSVLSLLVVAANIGLITARRAGSPLMGLFIASYFIAVFSVFPGGRVGLDDPQLLAHAMMLTGFSLFWLGGAGFANLLAAAALMVGAGLIKHNIVAVPLAITLWLALFDRKRLGAWLGAAGVSVMIALVLCALIWGPGFFQSLLTPRQITPSKLASAILLLRQMAPSLTLFTFLLFYPPSDTGHNKDWLVILYVLMALATGFFFYVGVGTSSNTFFDVVIGIVLGIGLLLMRVSSAPARTAMVVALVAGQLLMATMGLPKVLNGSISNQVARDQADIDFLAAHPGKVICRDLSLCYWAREEFTFDLFNMDQLYNLKKRNPETLLASVRRHEFSMVVQYSDAYEDIDPAEDRLMAAFRQTLQESYKVSRRSERFVFYVPR